MDEIIGLDDEPQKGQTLKLLFSPDIISNINYGRN
jgi:hypothetical protein